MALPLNTLCWVALMLEHPGMVVRNTLIKSIRNEFMAGFVSFLTVGEGFDGTR
jgi:hypothetical protein